MISIIIPTYNRSKLLFLCLESILLQTYKDIEIILLDDGSTDNTRLILSNFKDKRLVYVNIGRIGNISKLRNIGINLSKGEYIAFCDDDDVWKVNKLEIQMELINNYDFRLFILLQFFFANFISSFLGVNFFKAFDSLIDFFR